MAYDPMPYTATPQFTNPWVSTPSTHGSSQLFPSLLQSNLGYDGLHKSNIARPGSMSIPYSSVPASAPPMGANSYASLPYSQSELLSSSQDLMNNSRSAYDQAYSGAHSQTLNSYAPTPASYAPISSYGQSLQQQQQQQQQENTRRLSQSYAAIPRSKPV